MEENPYQSPEAELEPERPITGRRQLTTRDYVLVVFISLAIYIVFYAGAFLLSRL